MENEMRRPSVGKLLIDIGTPEENYARECMATDGAFHEQFSGGGFRKPTTLDILAQSVAPVLQL